MQLTEVRAEATTQSDQPASLSPNPYLPKIATPKAYAAMNPPMIMASIRALGELGLLSGEGVNASRNPHIGSIIELLIAQGIITLDTADIVFTPLGKEFIDNYELIDAMVSTYASVMASVEEIAGLKPEVASEPFSLSTYFQYADVEQTKVDAWLVPSLSLLELLKDQDGNTAASILASRNELDIDALVLSSPQAKVELQGFLRILIAADLIEPTTSTTFKATGKNKKLFRLAGYALLALSYYEVMEKLDKLVTGEEQYGLGKLYRNAEMNAHASNADISLAVGPKLTAFLNGELKFKGYEGEIDASTVIDYGSGGAEILMRFVEGVEGIDRAYGIDFNPKTVVAAEKIVEERGQSDSISLLNGSIIDREDMQALRDKIEADGFKPGIANISAIMHDIGHKAAEDFLNLHAEIFGDTPIMITEAMRVPLAAKTAHPDYRPNSFDFMHDISLQELFKESELLALLDKCGYEILGTKVYSSIPAARTDEERHTVGVTFLVQHKG